MTCTCTYLLFSGFCGTHRPPAHNVPDVHDEADFDIPYTQAELERFMSNVQPGWWWVLFTICPPWQSSRPFKFFYGLFIYGQWCISYIFVIFKTYTMHIPGISNKFRLCIQKIWIAYTLYMLCICYVYYLYIPMIYSN